MYIALSSRWFRLIAGMGFCAVALALFAQASPRESVRAELIRLQNQSGLTHATWSPDGNRIAFLEADGYYAIRPSGSERKRLANKKDGLKALWWSPDSRFVA